MKKGVNGPSSVSCVYTEEVPWGWKSHYYVRLDIIGKEASVGRVANCDS